MIKQKFIAFEGIDGAGKSSHVSWFAETLRERGARVTMTREPGGTHLGEIWREQLLRDEMTKESQTLLMFASRSEHLDRVIRPSLARGDWVICDRFTDATYAYQGGGHGVSLDLIDTLAKWLHGDCMPDVTLLFDVPVETARQRLSREGRPPDRFESEQGGFMQRVREAYLALAAANPQRYHVIDGARTKEAIRKELIDFIDKLFLQ